jgi:feruloyl-CoA hydratase/lyase
VTSEIVADPVVRPRETVLVERDNGITWVTLNRPEKRNAMSPKLHLEMLEVLEELEVDDATRVVVLTGAGDKSWCAGQDLGEFFRGMDEAPSNAKLEVSRASIEWRWYRLNKFAKPTIAMVNGYCFGGGFTQLIACDFAIAADDAVFGLSEINWGILPAGLVSRVLAEVIPLRDALYYVMTGETFDGKKAEEMRLVTRSVPRAQLRETVVDLAKVLMEKNPVALRACKEAYKLCKDMDFPAAEDYLVAKFESLHRIDPESGYRKGIERFIDEKRYRPGFENYRTAK